jgi:hypothetical protein
LRELSINEKLTVNLRLGFTRLGALTMKATHLHNDFTFYFQ